MQPSIGNRVAFTGFAACGKSTAAEHLVASLGYKELAFATPLKQIVSEVFSCNGWDKTEQVGNRSVRELLQIVGTELFRNELSIQHPEWVGRSVWIEHLIRRVNALPTTTSIVVSDVRFEDEAAALCKIGFTVYHITRKGYDPSPHSSEAGIEGVDGTIHNCGTSAYLTHISSRFAPQQGSCPQQQQTTSAESEQ